MSSDLYNQDVHEEQDSMDSSSFSMDHDRDFPKEIPRDEFAMDSPEPTSEPEVPQEVNGNGSVLTAGLSKYNEKVLEYDDELVPDEFELKGEDEWGIGLFSRIRINPGKRLGPFDGIFHEDKVDSCDPWPVSDNLY